MHSPPRTRMTNNIIKEGSRGRNPNIIEKYCLGGSGPADVSQMVFVIQGAD